MSEEFIQSNQRFAVNLVFGLLAWLFSVFVFLPLTVIYAPDWAGLVAILLFFDVSYYALMAYLNSKPFFEYLSNRVSEWYSSWRNVDEESKPVVWRRTRKVLKVAVILVVYLMYRPILWVVSPVITGLVS